MVEYRIRSGETVIYKDELAHEEHVAMTFDICKPGMKKWSSNHGGARVHFEVMRDGNWSEITADD